MAYEIITAGSLMTDILVANLSEISKPTNVTYVETDFREKIGGHPIDVCIDLVKIGYDPKKTAVIGVVGGEKDDMFAKFILDTIKNYGITTKFIKKIKGRKTGKNVVLEVKGEDRRFHISPGANQELNPEYIKKVLKKHKPKIFSARPCYTGMDSHMESILKTAWAKTTTVMDVCKPYKIKWADLLPSLKYVDVLHGNERELKGLAGKDNLDDAVKVLLDYGAQIIFLTRGNKGNAVLVTKNLKISQPPFDATPYIQKGEAIDATGCGDAFCAGVIYKILEHGLKWFEHENCNELANLLMFAQAVGASAATKIGCTEGVSEETLESLLLDQKDNILRKTNVNYT